MNLFELFVKIGVKDEATKNIEGISSKLGNGLKTAAKIGTAAVGAAAAGIVALTKAAVDNYAEYEQLVGGAELMFGKAYDTVAKNAQEAYKTVQMSQNEYLQQVNGFATGLKTALGGNEQAAAELSHKIVKAEADIIAATGNSAENVQNAFNGIMRSNFTMLDNLQIGIKPTKEGFQEVIDKVNDWNKANGNATKYQMGNLADMQSALVDYIDMVGMSGYAQKEASETITGSLSSMKSAWTNLVTGFANDGADLDQLIGNLTDSVVGYTDESGKKVKGVLDNLLPTIEKSLVGIASLIEGAAPKIIEILPGLAEQLIPSLISAATGMVNAVVAVLPNLLNTVVGAIIDNAPILMDAGIALVNELVGSVLQQLPQIVALGLDLIVSLANGIANNIPVLIPTIIDVILKIVDVLTNQESITNLLKAAFSIITELAGGLIKNIDKIIAAAMTLLDGMIDFFLRPANLAMLIETAIQLVLAIGVGIIKAIPMLLVSVGSLIESIFTNFKTADWVSIGTNLVAGLKKGISNAWANLKSWFRGLFGDLIGVAKKILGIASPSKVFAEIGKFMAEGVGVGWNGAFRDIQRDINDSLDFDGGYIGSFGGGALGGADGYMSRDINIVQNIYSQAKTAAELMREARWQAKMEVLTSV